MLLDVFKQLVRCKELWVPANYFQFLFRRVGQENKILHYTQQPFFAEHPLHHSQQGRNSFRCLVLRFYLPPGIKEIVWSKERAIFTVRSVTNHHKSIVFEQIRNVSSITHRELGICIHDGCILFHGTFEFQHHHWKSIDIDNTIGNTFFSSLYLQLIHDTEDVVALCIKINRFNEQIRQGSIFTLQRKSFRYKTIGCHVVFVE